MARKQSRKNQPKAYILEPGQSLKQYKALENKWYSKIRAKSFQDIEFLDARGFSSPFTRDYSLARLRQEYNPASEEYFRRARIFLHEFVWDAKALQGLNSNMARFIWAHYAEGFTLRDIVKALNGTGESLVKGRRPSKRTEKGAAQRPPTLFWVHLKLTNVLLPAFDAWCKANPDKLGVDWALD